MGKNSYFCVWVRALFVGGVFLLGDTSFSATCAEFTSQCMEEGISRDMHGDGVASLTAGKVGSADANNPCQAGKDLKAASDNVQFAQAFEASCKKVADVCLEKLVEGCKGDKNIKVYVDHLTKMKTECSHDALTAKDQNATLDVNAENIMKSFCAEGDNVDPLAEADGGEEAGAEGGETAGDPTAPPPGEGPGGGGGLKKWLVPAAIGAAIGAGIGMLGGDDDEDDKKGKKDTEPEGPPESPEAPEVPPPPEPKEVQPDDDGDDDGDGSDGQDDDGDGGDDSDKEDVADNALPSTPNLDYGGDGASDGSDSEGTTIETDYDPTLCEENLEDPLCQAESLGSASRREEAQNASDADGGSEDDGSSSGASGESSGGSSTGAFEGGQDGDASVSRGPNSGGEDDEFAGERGLSHNGSGSQSKGDLFLSDSIRGAALPEGAGTARNAPAQEEGNEAQKTSQPAPSRGLASSPNANSSDKGVISPQDAAHPCNKNPNGRECLQLQNQAINENIIERYRKMGIYLDK